MRCVVIDCCPVYLVGLESLLRGAFVGSTILTATSLAEAALLFTSPVEIHMVILDLLLCSVEHSQFAHVQDVLRRCPASFVIGSDESQSESFTKLGARAFLHRNSRPEEVIRLLYEAANPRADCMSPVATSTGWSNVMMSLTDRQRDVLDLLLVGSSNKRIASCLNLTYGTVKNYVLNLMRQFNVRSRLELVAKLHGMPQRTTLQSNLRALPDRRSLRSELIEGRSNSMCK